MTTADQAPRGAPRATKLFAAPNSQSGRLFTEKSWDHEATHTDDPETYLPLARLAEHVEAGHVGRSARASTACRRTSASG